MCGAQWRGTVEQRYNRLLRGKIIGFSGHAKAQQRLQPQAHRLASKAIDRIAFVGVDIDAREPLLSDT
jgi:hypothetical protein